MPRGDRRGGEISGANGRSMVSITMRARAAALDHGHLHIPPQWMARRDAEVAADVGNDGADRTAAGFGGDLRRRGQVGETQVDRGRGGRWLGGGALAGGCAASRWAACRSTRASSALARCRPREMLAKISARSVVPKQITAELGSVAVRPRIVAARSRPESISLDQVEQKAAAAGLGGWGAGCSRHEHEENTGAGKVSCQVE